MKIPRLLKYIYNSQSLQPTHAGPNPIRFYRSQTAPGYASAPDVKKALRSMPVHATNAATLRERSRDGRGMARIATTGSVSERELGASRAHVWATAGTAAVAEGGCARCCYADLE